MAIEHVDITDPDIHEIKGAAAASANTVPIANGSGGTAFAKIDVDNIDTSSIFNTNQYYLQAVIDDISTAGSIYVPIVHAGYITTIYTALQGAITGADAVITFRNNAGTSLGTLTVANAGSAAGDIDTTTITPSPGQFSAGHFLKIDTDGASTNAVKLFITILFIRTA